MNYLSLDQVVSLHERVTGERPGTARVSNPEGLAYCVMRPQADEEGHDLFPTLEEKTAALLESMIRLQPFIDGNRRTAWAGTCQRL